MPLETPVIIYCSPMQLLAATQCLQFIVKAFNLVHKKKERRPLDTFTNTESTKEEVKAAGEQFILKLYDTSKFESLDAYRHIAYRRTIGSRGSVNSVFLLESLPPTSAAAENDPDANHQNVYFLNPRTISHRST